MHTAEAPHLHAGFQACLTVLEAAFVLETEFIQLTRSCYRSVARLKHLHWLRTDWVSLSLKLQGNDQLITSLRAPRRCLSLSTQPQANKPSVRRLTSSRRFDYLIVKEQHTKNALQRSDLAIWLKTLSPNQRKERNDNAKSNLVKQVFAGSEKAANTR